MICIKTYTLAIKLPHKINQNYLLLHFYQLIANISHILHDPKYCDIYRVSVQSIGYTIHIGSLFRY